MVKLLSPKMMFTAGGLCIMMLILLSNSSSTAKGIGVILSMMVVIVGFIISSPLKKLFEETREGNMDPYQAHLN